MPSVSLGTNFYIISLEKFEESVNRRRIDNTIKEQTMIYKTLHRKLKMEQHQSGNQNPQIEEGRTDNTMANRKRTNNDLQNTTQKTKDGATRASIKTEGFRCSRKVISSYCIAACEILRFPSEIYRQYTYIVDKYIIYFYEL
jgi:hypothetical protein